MPPSSREEVDQPWLIANFLGFVFFGNFVCVIDRTCNATDYILMICLSFIKSFISSALPIAPAHQLSASAAFATKDSLNVKLRRKYIRDDGHSVGHTKKPSHNKLRLFDLLMMGGEAKKGEK